MGEGGIRDAPEERKDRINGLVWVADAADRNQGPGPVVLYHIWHFIAHGFLSASFVPFSRLDVDTDGVGEPALRGILGLGIGSVREVNVLDLWVSFHGKCPGSLSAWELPVGSFISDGLYDYVFRISHMSPCVPFLFLGNRDEYFDREFTIKNVTFPSDDPVGNSEFSIFENLRHRIEDDDFAGFRFRRSNFLIHICRHYS